MAAPFNYQIFQNVTTKEDFLTNIKTVASDNGWTIDKDDISANAELYLHSTGNGSQNLYYSMKILQHSGHYLTTNYFMIYSNTGFDSGASYDSQPGKWYESYTDWASSTEYVLPEIEFPINNQYVLANSQMILGFNDVYSGGFPNDLFQNLRFIMSYGIGAIDTYKSGETEGNYLYNTTIGRYENNEFHVNSAIRGTYQFSSFSKENSSAGILYNGSNKYNNSLGISTPYFISYIAVSGYSKWVSDYTNDDYMSGHKGYRYNYGVRYNDWASRNSLIKPIVSIADSDATNTYFYPIGELPYYATIAYPYAKAGDILNYGTRKFMVFPILYYTNGTGVAVEVN